jgi:hypothetical protein
MLRAKTLTASVRMSTRFRVEEQLLVSFFTVSSSSWMSLSLAWNSSLIGVDIECFAGWLIELWRDNDWRLPLGSGAERDGRVRIAASH